MKSFARYALTVGSAAVVATVLAIAVLGPPSATAQPAAPQTAPQPAQPSDGRGGSAAVPVVTQPDKGAAASEASGPDAVEAQPLQAGSGAGEAADATGAGSATGSAGAGSGSADGAGAGSAKPKRPKVELVDCTIAPKDAVRIKTGQAGFLPKQVKVVQNAIIVFELSGDAIVPYPDGEQALVAPAGATTCVKFTDAGEFKFTSNRPIEGKVLVQTWYEALAERPVDEVGNFWMPKAVNSEAASTDNMFYAVYGLSIFFFVAITGCVVYFVIRYRHRPGHKAEPSAAHNDAMEITWTVIPTIICVFLFYYGWRTYVRVVTPPVKAVEINVLAWRWNWQFTHANGVQDKDLHVPVGVPVRLVMTSKDVLHAFYAPVMRVKQDIIPRRYTYVWFKADKPGTYRLNCAEYCGTDHSQMGITAEGRRAVVVVHESGKYEQYLSDLAASSLTMDPDKLGAKLYDKKGCVSCHSLDGTPRIGPSFKGLWGSKSPLEGGGSALVDENYVLESITKPQAKIHQGYPPSMPSFEGQLKPVEIEGLIAFMKTLK